MAINKKSLLILSDKLVRIGNENVKISERPQMLPENSLQHVGIADGFFRSAALLRELANQK